MSNAGRCPPELGGEPRSTGALPCLAGYARVAEGSLTAAFILSQHDAGVRRLALGRSTGRSPRRWLDSRSPTVQAFATVGLSQLTTSTRRHGRASRACRGRFPAARFRIERSCALGDRRPASGCARHRRCHRRRSSTSRRPPGRSPGSRRSNRHSPWPPCKHRAPPRSPARGWRSSCRRGSDRPCSRTSWPARRLRARAAWKPPPWHSVKHWRRSARIMAEGRDRPHRTCSTPSADRVANPLWRDLTAGPPSKLPARRPRLPFAGRATPWSSAPRKPT